MTTKKLKLPNSFGQILIALGTAFAGTLLGSEDFPIVPEDVEVALYAKDPLVRNPCVITFDSQGRLCVGMGPQYRAPGQETPADSVWIITDEDGDGLAETRKEFATGFNSVQGLAWKGDWLWVANAPELTRVRDTNGDDLADEYIRVYTDLGNLEHALHGLNFGPDGRLYMSKGNSKGLTILPDRLAPSAFRELWGIQVPKGTPEPHLGTSPLMITLTGLEQTMTKPWGTRSSPPSTVRILDGAMHGATIGKAMTTCRRLLQADLFSKVRAPGSSIARSTSIQAYTTMSFSLAIGSIEKFSSIARSGTEHGANQIATSWKSLPMQEVGAAWR